MPEDDSHAEGADTAATSQFTVRKPLRCRLALHRWSSRPATARMGTTVSRCMLCHEVRVVHRRKPRADRT